MGLINLTPHNVVIQIKDGLHIAVPASGQVLRVEESTEEVGYVSGVVPVFRKTYGAAGELPPEEDGTYYIVSSLTAQACPERKDFLIPGPAIRDDQGRIVACHGLCCL